MRLLAVCTAFALALLLGTPAHAAWTAGGVVFISSDNNYEWGTGTSYPCSGADGASSYAAGVLVVQCGQLQTGGARDYSLWKRQYIWDNQSPGLAVTMTVSLGLDATASAENPHTSGCTASGKAWCTWGGTGDQLVSAERPGGAVHSWTNPGNGYQNTINDDTWLYGTTWAQVSLLGSLGMGCGGPDGTASASSSVSWSNP